MLVTGALIRDTFREAMARKIFVALFIVESLYVLFFLFIMKIDIVQGTLATITVFGRTSPGMDAQRLVSEALGAVASFLYTFGMALAVFASAGLIPSVLEPGRIELLLSKPVSRHHILLGRYLGNVLVVGIIIAYMIVAVWAILGIKTGIWSTNFLATIATTVVAFGVLLTVVVFMGVVWESTAVSTLVAISIMIISAILSQWEWAYKLLSSEWARYLWKGLYFALPKIFDLGAMTRAIVMHRPVESWMPLWSSGLFAAVLLSAALYIFAKRDF
jgi:ABC-type transport system involved in multi-copper enzyme maturation permease subunit